MKPSTPIFVRNLTLPSSERRSFDVYSDTHLPSNSWLLRVAAIVIVLAIGTDAFATQDWQPPEDITAAAESHLREKTGTLANHTAVRAGTLDARHRLPLCDQALESFMRRGARIDSRTIVGVRCTGSKPWKVYVPVDVIVTRKVLIARRALPRGHLLTAADLSADERDVSRMVSGYISDPRELEGQRLKQQLIAGRVITPAMLVADHIVRRGQTVTLTAAGGGVNISMSGKALMDGALNQRIRVENINSGRVVEGVVRSREQVEILVPSSHRFFNAKPKVSP